MALPATDNFNRANGALGANWSGSIGGDLVITSNQVTGVSGQDCNMYWSADLPDADQYVEATLVTRGSYAGIICRMSATDGVFFYANVGAGNYRIEWYNDASYTLIGSVAEQEPVNGDRLRLEAEGTAYRGYVNDILICSGSNASAPATGYCGLYAYSNSPRLDDFEVGNLAAPAARIPRAGATLDGPMVI
jgi:hypothetical protein